MASSKEYLDFILEQVSELDNISYKAMMGEFIIYYNGKILAEYMMIDYLLNLCSLRYIICQMQCMSCRMME